MKIVNTQSCIDNELVEMGYARNHIGRVFLYGKHDAESRERVHALMDRIASEFVVYQYDHEKKIDYRDRWELYFWCNDLMFTGEKGERGCDYSHISLSFNDRDMTADETEAIKNRLLKMLEEADLDCCSAHAQLETLHDDKRILNDALAKANALVGKRAEYRGMKGRVIRDLRGYVFFMKSRARTKGYMLNSPDKEKAVAILKTLKEVAA